MKAILEVIRLVGMTISKLKRLSINGLIEPIERDEKIKHNYGRMAQIIDNLYKGDKNE